MLGLNNYELIFLGTLLAWLFNMIYAGRRLAYYLQMAQQTSYRPERYWRWLRPRLAQELYLVDTIAILMMIASTFLIMQWISLPVLKDWQVWGLIAVPPLAAVLPLLFWRRPPVKKPLVWTARAKRLYATALIIWGLLLAIQPVCTFRLEVNC